MIRNGRIRRKKKREEEVANKKNQNQNHVGKFFNHHLRFSLKISSISIGIKQ